MISTFNNKYDCKLTTRALLGIEKDLGNNPVNLIFNNGELPQLNIMLKILYYSARKENPQIKSFDDIIDIYDEYLKDGGSLSGLAQFIVELIENSGMIGDKEETDNKDKESKN